MKKIIGVVSQKGGVGKSTIARLIAIEYAKQGKNVIIADTDTSQSTCYEWNIRRINSNLKPKISVEKFDDITEALFASKEFDILIFDGAPHATRATHQIVKESNIIILPTGSSLEDLNPQIKLAHEIVQNGTDKKIIYFILSKINSSNAELRDAINYILTSGYYVFDNTIPEKIAFRQALTEGKIITETKYKSLNSRSKQIFDDINNKINELI